MRASSYYVWHVFDARKHRTSLLAANGDVDDAPPRATFCAWARLRPSWRLALAGVIIVIVNDAQCCVRGWRRGDSLRCSSCGIRWPFHRGAARSSQALTRQTLAFAATWRRRRPRRCADGDRHTAGKSILVAPQAAVASFWYGHRCLRIGARSSRVCHCTVSSAGGLKSTS